MRWPLRGGVKAVLVAGERKAAAILADEGAAAAEGRVTGTALRAARREFGRVRPKFWKNQAATNPKAWSAKDLARMEKGKAPMGKDGFPMELHHIKPLAEGGSNSFGNLRPLTRTEHRLGANYKKNHPNLP